MRAVMVVGLLSGCAAGVPSGRGPVVPVTAGEGGGGGDRVRVGPVEVIAVPVDRSQFMFWVVGRDQTRVTQFRPWSDDVSRLPPMCDEFGNAYPAGVSFLPGTRIRESVGQAISSGSGLPHVREFLDALPPGGALDGPGQVTAAAARGDLLSYPPPAPAAKRMIVRLPAANVGGTGVLTFEFDAARVAAMVAP